MAKRTTISVQIGDCRYTIGKLQLGDIVDHREALVIVREGTASAFPEAAKFAAHIEVAHAAIIQEEGRAEKPSLEAFTEYLRSLPWDEGWQGLTRMVVSAMTGNGFVEKTEAESMSASEPAAGAPGAPGEAAAGPGSSPNPDSAVSTG